MWRHMEIYLNSSSSLWFTQRETLQIKEKKMDCINVKITYATCNDDGATETCEFDYTMESDDNLRKKYQTIKTMVIEA